MTTTTISFPDSRERTRGVIMVFVAGMLWSTIGLGVRLIEDALVWQILLYRSISLTLFLYAVIRLRGGLAPIRLIRRAGWPGVVGALALVAAYSGGIYAIQSTSVANAMLLFASSPFMAALLGLWLLKEPVRRATWVAIAVAMGGIAIMVSDKSGTGALAGNLAALGSALGFAVFAVALRWGRNGEMLPAILLSGFFAIALMAAMCLILGLPLLLAPRDGAIALGMGVFQVGAGLVLFTIGSRVVTAAELTLLSLSEVLLGPFWVWLVLGETATMATVLGGTVLLGAIAANALSGARRKPPPLPSG